MDIRRWLTSPKYNNSDSKKNNSVPDDKNSKAKRSSSPKHCCTTSCSPSKLFDTKQQPGLSIPPLHSKSNSVKDPKASKRRRILDSDSDEDPVPKQKEESKAAKSPKKQGQAKAPIINKSEDKKKPVSVSQFFGSAPVIRNDKIKSNKTEKKSSDSIHEDPEFEATLKQLNSKPAKENKQNEKPKEPVKEVPKIKSPKEKNENKSKSRKSLSDSMEFEPAPKQKKTIVVEDPKPAPKKNKGNAGYASYLVREGPKALGSKEIPEGEEGCLAGLSFIITGVLESIERDEAKSLVEKYGGKVMTTLSKNTKYIVIGRDAGASKLDKAEKLGTKQLDEDGLFDLIRTLPGKKGTKSPAAKKKSPPKKNEKHKESEFDDIDAEFEKEMAEAADIFCSSELETGTVSKASCTKPKDEVVIKHEVKSENSEKFVKPDTLKQAETEKASTQPKVENVAGVSMWVDKYKPTSMKQIIGQQGDKSNAKKLFDWLVKWRKNRQLGKKPVFAGRYNVQDDGSGYKAALLSGPPGVGKTTTAQLVCKEAGFDYFELNASDTRSKKYLQQSVSQLLGNQTLSDCFGGDSSGKVSSKHVIIMDEVDGMAGNEDRGGMRELIDFIKASKVPIICICNDRNHMKIRSLSNYCFDLRFQKPRVEQIKAAMMSVAFKEGIKVTPEALQDVIVATNQDIRQVLHSMSMWSAKAKGLTSDQTKEDIGRGIKHIKMGPFDVLREVFAIGNKPKASIMDKSDLFFHDYSLAPLFVHENYVHVIPTAAEGDKKKHLTLLSEAADSICIGDIIDRQIRSGNNWSLLPTQAIFASVVPGELLRGHLRQMISFPAWLGKYSNKNRMDRILQELHVHMRMKITGNKTDVAMEYLPVLKEALTKPLIVNEQAGVPDVLKTMEEYYLLREDFDSIIDLSLWPNQTDPRTKINPKVKSAFTRAYNKDSGKNPYAVTNVKKKKGSAKDLDAEINPDDEAINDEEEEEDDSIENDAMIKVKKPSKKNSATASTEPSSSKEKKKNTSKKGKSK